MKPRFLPALLMVAVCSTAFGLPAGEPGAAFTRADHRLVRELVETSGVDRSVPSPTLEQYSMDVSQAVQSWIAATLKPGPALVQLLLEGAQWVGLVVLVVAAVLLALVVLRALASRRRGRKRSGDGELRARKAADTGTDATPETWWQRFEAALADHLTAEALAALWWWLARTLAGDGAEPSWTTRQLIRHTRATRLTGSGGELDRLIYGPGTASTQAIRALAERLRKELA